MKVGNVFDWGFRGCVPRYSVGYVVMLMAVFTVDTVKKKDLVCCEAVWSGKHVSTFQKSLLPP